MGDGFRGVSADRDGRFRAADRKLMAKMKFPPEFSTKVDMRKVQLDVLRPWVGKKVTQYLGVEDDIIINMVMAELEKENEPDPRMIQINLTGFLERNTGAFMAELWKLLCSAQSNAKEEKGKVVKGMPEQLLHEKQEELNRINSELQERARKIQDDQERMKAIQREREAERERAVERERELEREKELRRRLEQEQEELRKADKAKEEKGDKDKERDRDRDRERDRDRDRDRKRDRRSRSRSRDRRDRDRDRDRDGERERRHKHKKERKRDTRSRSRSKSRSRSPVARRADDGSD